MKKLLLLSILIFTTSNAQVNKYNPTFDETGRFYKLNFITQDSLNISQGIKSCFSIEKKFEKNKAKYDSIIDTLKTSCYATSKPVTINCGKEWIYIKEKYQKLLFKVEKGQIILGWNKENVTTYWVVEDMFMLTDNKITDLRIRSQTKKSIKLWKILN